MKALRIHEYGAPLQLDQVEAPVAGPGEAGWTGAAESQPAE